MVNSIELASFVWSDMVMSFLHGEFYGGAMLGIFLLIMIIFVCLNAGGGYGQANRVVFSASPPNDCPIGIKVTGVGKNGEVKLW